MDPPLALSLEEIRKYMLLNNCKVTNHALVKHFRNFLTNPDSQEEARKLFKSYVNILATMKNENNEKFLVLRKKYLHECPPEDIVNKTIDCPSPASPGNSSISSDNFSSPFRQPPPYKPPPEVSPNVSGLPKVQSSVQQQQQSIPISYGIGVPKEMTSNYRECVNEFAAAVRRIDPNRIQEQASSIPITPEEALHSNNDVLMQEQQQQPPILPPRKRTSIDQNSVNSLSRENSHEENKENVDDKGNLPEKNNNVGQRSNEIDNKLTENENQISVKEATRKFNRMASEEEAKVVSPPSKKKPEKTVEETPEVTLAHPKAKEWLVSAAKANYQELAKLLTDHPELVRLQNPSTGYTGLHWAAKHGNEDVVKLIAGTYKADVNARTNGGYTPLHLAMQFGRDNIFELLCNVYKANRDITDWSGNKPLDYRRQRTTVSASTYSSEYFDILLQNQQQTINLQQRPGSLKHKKRSQPQRSTTFNINNSSPLQRARSLMIGKNKKNSPLLNRKQYKNININNRMSHNIQDNQRSNIFDGFDEIDEGLIPATTFVTETDNNLPILQPSKEKSSTLKRMVSSKKSFKN